MCWQTVFELAAQSGFPFYEAIEAEPLSFYSPNAEAKRQGITAIPQEILREAGSILILGMPITWRWREKEGYATLPAFYPVSNRAYQSAKELAQRLKEKGYIAEFTSRLAIKPYAEKAMNARYGMNTLMLHPQCGSAIALQSILLGLPPSKSKPIVGFEACRRCGACVRICPNHAIEADGVDPYKCLRTWTLSGEIMPEAYRTQNGLSLLGCERCQAVCPENSFVHFQEYDPPECLSIQNLLKADRETLSELARLIGKNDARKERILAQACLIAGNDGDPRYLPRLLELALHPRPAVAQHAQWAVEQIKRSGKRREWDAQN